MVKAVRGVLVKDRQTFDIFELVTLKISYVSGHFL